MNLQRLGDTVTLRLTSQLPGPPVSIRLRRDDHGGWSGQMSGDPASHKVVMGR